MLGVIIFCFAAATAAPYYGGSFHPMPFHPEQHYDRLRHPYFGENVFDMQRFWSELSSEMRELDNILADLYKRFPTPVASSQGIDGKEYKVTIPLMDFEEKDIVVKARTGVLMVQAVHKHEGNVQNSYVDVRTLPDCVSVNGTWTYSKGVLKIVFPLKTEDATDVVPLPHETTTDVTTESFVTQGPTESREEMENHVESDDLDADVGLNRGDTDKASQTETKNDWRSNVEATTYAVDLTNEVEFVPVHY